MEYTIVHTVNAAESGREEQKLAAARAVYAELLKYCSEKNPTEISA